MASPQVRPSALNRSHPIARGLASLILLASVGAALGQPAFPLKPSANHRFLVDQNEKPFFLSGDSPWDIFQNVDLEDARAYLDDRRARGFNTLLVTLVADRQELKRDRWGRWPFKEGREFREPNEAYWRHVDEVMAEMEKRGFFVMACPTWVDLWSKELQNDAMKEYGPFLAQRYGKYRNLGWLLGGDRNPSAADEQGTRWLAEALHRAVPHQLISYHPAPGNPSGRFFHREPWLALNSAYTYGLSIPQVAGEWKRREPVLPVYLCETGYEGESNGGRAWVPCEIRKQHYWALTSGACGHAHGSKQLWWFGPGWREWLDKPATRDMARIRSFFMSRAWWQLAPDLDHAFLTAGAPGADPWQQATAAVATDGSWAAVYVPTPRRLSVNMTKLSGPVAARWYDPTSGDYSPAPGRRGASEGTHVFESPATNQAGDSDWVLVLETSHPVESGK